MVEPHSVKAIFQGEYSLNFISPNGGVEYVIEGDFFSIPVQVICHRKDCTEVIRRVTPFRGQPCVVEVQPTNQRPNVKSGADGIKPLTGSWCRGSFLHLSSRNYRPDQLDTGFVAES